MVVAGRGSQTQLFVAVVVTFLCTILQKEYEPYRHTEDNNFKLAVELQLFLTVLIALTLSNEDDAAQIALFDLLLLLSVFGMLVCLVWNVYAKLKLMRQALRKPMAEEDTEATAIKRAVQLLQLGLISNEDTRLLSTYFGKLDRMANKWNHVRAALYASPVCLSDVNEV
eukprot:COSAG06_NODE_2910_length_6103_cov_2.350600_4_plen_169_part_00